VIESYRKYFYNGLIFIDDLYLNGPYQVSATFPKKKPGFDLELLLGWKKN
jgi:hypothetical protein